MKLLSGHDLNVPMSDNYLVVETENPRVVFSYARKGNAITAHFACNKSALRQLKPKINEFCQWIFDSYEWCEMIFALIEIHRKSVERLVKKCGFSYLTSSPEAVAYVRMK